MATVGRRQSEGLDPRTESLRSAAALAPAVRAAFEDAYAYRSAGGDYENGNCHQNVGRLLSRLADAPGFDPSRARVLWIQANSGKIVFSPPFEARGHLLMPKMNFHVVLFVDGHVLDLELGDEDRPAPPPTLAAYFDSAWRGSDHDQLRIQVIPPKAYDPALRWDYRDAKRHAEHSLFTLRDTEPN